jgi:hypothetical protein
MLEITKVLNMATSVKFTITGRDLKEELLMAEPIINMPTKCGICGNTAYLHTRQTKEGEYIYIESRCSNKDCKAKANMGEYKSPKGAMFWKKFEVYKPEAAKEETPF